MTEGVITREIALSLLSHFAYTTQLILGFVFLLSALPKLRNPLLFAQRVEEYKILPSQIALLLGLVLLPLEAFLAIAFLTGWLVNIALPISAVLFIVFTAAVGINVWRGRKVPCGCFGGAEEKISPRTLGRLALLLMAALFLLTSATMGNTSLSNIGSMTASTPVFTYLLPHVFLAAFLMLLAMWVLNLPELVFVLLRSNSGDLLRDKNWGEGGTRHVR